MSVIPAYAELRCLSNFSFLKGVVQVIVWRRLRDKQRAEVVASRLLAVSGVWQREGNVCNLIAGHLEDLSPLLGRLATESRDFR